METTPGTESWYAQVKEDILEPDRPIIDPHHHLWTGGGRSNYLLEDFWQDTGSGHRILKTVFIECGTHYRETGPDYLKSVGETEFAADIAGLSAAAGAGKAVISGIVGHVDLTRQETREEALEKHAAASKGLLRGIRHAGAHHPHPEEGYFAGNTIPGCFWMKTFKQVCVFSGGAGIPMKAGIIIRSCVTLPRWSGPHQKRRSSLITLAPPWVEGSFEISAKKFSGSGN